MSDQQVYELFIRTTPEKLWRVLTDGTVTPQFFHGTSVRSTLRVGEPIVWALPDGRPAVEGEVLEVDAPRLLVHTWRIRYNEAMSGELSRVTWRIEPRGEAVKLTTTHDLEGAPLTAKNVGTDGWSVVLSGLKTLLETGKPLEIAD